MDTKEASKMNATTPEVFEYEVYELDDRFRLWHNEKPLLLATNDLGEACSFMSAYNKSKRKPVCIYQPRTDHYRGHIAKWLPEETVDE